MNRLSRILTATVIATMTVGSLTACATADPWNPAQYPRIPDSKIAQLPYGTYNIDYTEHPDQIGLSHGTGTLIFDEKQGCSFTADITTEMDPNAAGPDWYLNPTIKAVKGFNEDVFHYSEKNDRWYSGTSGYTNPGIPRPYLDSTNLVPVVYSSLCIVTAIPAITVPFAEGDPAAANTYAFDKKLTERFLHAASDALAKQHAAAIEDTVERDSVAQKLAATYYQNMNPNLWLNSLATISAENDVITITISNGVETDEKGTYRLADLGGIPTATFVLSPYKAETLADPLVHALPDGARTFTGVDLSKQMLAEGKLN